MQCVARTPSQSFLVLEVMRNLLGCHSDCSPWKQPLKISYLDCDNKTHHITPTHVLTATFLHTRWQGWGQNSQRRTSTTRTCTNTVFAASASCAASVASCAASFVALQAASLASCAASCRPTSLYYILHMLESCWWTWNKSTSTIQVSSTMCQTWSRRQRCGVLITMHQNSKRSWNTKKWKRWPSIPWIFENASGIHIYYMKNKKHAKSS